MNAFIRAASTCAKEQGRGLEAGPAAFDFSQRLNKGKTGQLGGSTHSKKIPYTHGGYILINCDL